MAKRRIPYAQASAPDAAQARIIAALTPAFEQIGLLSLNLGKAKSTFGAELDHAQGKRGIIQTARIVFLDRVQARHFGCTTASFSIEIGVTYPFIEGTRLGAAGWPDASDCHIRANLPRPYRQPPPNRALERADRKRRNIWWIDEQESWLERALRSASETIVKKGRPLLARYSDPGFAYWYLRRWPGKVYRAGSPFNLGTRESPYRQMLIAALGAELERRKSPGSAG